jgi:hypothetical protein
MESEKEKKIVIVQLYVINSLIQKFTKILLERKFTRPQELQDSKFSDNKKPWKFLIQIINKKY